MEFFFKTKQEGGYDINLTFLQFLQKALVISFYAFWSSLSIIFGKFKNSICKFRWNIPYYHSYECGFNNNTLHIKHFISANLKHIALPSHFRNVMLNFWLAIKNCEPTFWQECICWSGCRHSPVKVNRFWNGAAC